MRASGRRTFWRNLCKRLTAAGSLLTYLAASFGLPVPAPAAPRDRSVPYPCMDKPCGCACAEDCWRHCCCTTPEERWAWAAAHHVQPPDYAERPGCHPDGAASAGERPCPHCHPQTAAPSSLEGPTASALRCKGLSTLWISAGTTPVLSTVGWRPGVVRANRLTYFDQLAFRLSLAPPSPPPRISFSA